MKIEIGKTYFFNNRAVEVLRIEKDQFAFVMAKLNIDHNISGHNFCIPCNVGGLSGHACEDAQEVIDALMEEIGEKDVFWVDVRYLKKAPFEYKTWKKIKEETDELIIEKETLIKRKQDLIKMTDEMEKQKQNISISIEEETQKWKHLLSEVENLKIKKAKITFDSEEAINLSNSSLSLSMKQILHFIERSIRLDYLEKGGVNNWNWYEESLPNDSDQITNEALESLLSYVK